MDAAAITTVVDWCYGTSMARNDDQVIILQRRAKKKSQGLHCHAGHPWGSDFCDLWRFAQKEVKTYQFAKESLPRIEDFACLWWRMWAEPLSQSNHSETVFRCGSGIRIQCRGRFTKGNISVTVHLSVGRADHGGKGYST